MTIIEFKDCMNNIGCPDLADRIGTSNKVGTPEDLRRLKEQREFFAKNYKGFTESKTCKDLDEIISLFENLIKFKIAVANGDIESIYESCK